jgi:hypothetical protein
MEMKSNVKNEFHS